ncbi:MAG: AAA family ATPase [Gammaproteobacteria bacterium]|nr:AAA family ATPase [Gammaproteobacteria bacterium]
MIAIPGYEITEQIYEGDMTLVLRGKREPDNLPVIVKILNMENPPFEKVAAFKHEARTMTNLEMLTCVPKVYELKKYYDSWMMVFEDIQGQTLAYYIAKKTFNVFDFLDLTINIVSALEQVHKKGIVHKDINPFNIVWNPQSNKLQIIDFGIASNLSHENVDHKNINMLEGTLSYLSPEQTGRMNRLIDHRSDFYSLGITAYQMLTGQLPFDSEDPLELIHQHIVKIPVPPHEINNEIPEMLSAIIMKLIAKKAEDRYQTEYGIKYDLLHCLRELRKRGTIDTFDVGKKDLISGFELPQKLYGREEEIKTLMNVFENVCLSSREVAVISGYAGIGKSTLINELYKSIVAKRGYLIQGKFDQFQRNLPCLALSRMLQDYVDQVLTESFEQRAEWKNKILGAVGENGQILIEHAPSMELIIGKQPPLMELDPAAAESRFLYVIKNVVQVLAQKEHPFVIFWDDIQWADSISFKLLEVLLLQTTGYLFYVFCYRDNEVDEGHPFKLILNRVERELPLYKIQLKPLSLEAVSQLIADTLHTEKEEVKALAEICYTKTSGNPFFLNQLIKVLYNKKIIYFETAKGRWTWDVSMINEQSVADNVLELLLARLDALNEHSRIALNYASCLGNMFDLKTTATLLNRSEHETAQLLDEALRENYLIPLNDNYRYAMETEGSGTVYRFAHEKIREVIYEKISAEKKGEINLRIGRLLKNVTLESELENKVIAIADHFNRGIHLITDENEKYELVTLNLKAGIKAKHSQAFEQASYYLETGISLLKESDWNDRYDIALSLYTEAAEVNSFLANYEKMQFFNDVVISKARSILDLTKIYRIKISAEIARGNLTDAIRVGQQFLKKMNYNLPFHPGNLQVIRAVIRARLASRKVKPEEVMNLPTLKNDKMKAIQQIMLDLAAPSFQAQPELSIILFSEVFRITVKYGVSEFTPYSFMCYAIVLGGILRDYEGAYKFAKLAIELIPKFEAKAYQAKILFTYYFFVSHLKNYYKDDVDLLKDAYYSGLEVGDLEYAIYGLSFPSAVYLFGSDHLQTVADHSNKTAEYMMKFNKDFKMVTYHLIHLQLMTNLLGKNSGSPSSFTGPFYNENEQVPLHLANQDILGLAFLYIHKLMMAYLFGDMDSAVQFINQEKPYAKVLLSCFHYPIYLFYALLTDIAVYPEMKLTDKLKVRVRIAMNLYNLGKLAKSAPMNYRHKYCLVKAELYRIKGNYEKALDYYEDAIQFAHENEFINDEALAKELTAKFYFQSNKEKVGKIYLFDAFYSYSLWGATAKLDQLKTDYPWLAKALLQPHLFGFLSALTSKTYKTDELDYGSAMKASVTIASEIVLPKLIARLLEILTENIGAERCVLLYQQNDKLMVEGEFNSQQKILSLMQSIPLESDQLELPLTIIQYVNSTHESLLLDNASEVKQFMRDMYIIKQAPKSVLCFPILYQGRLLGILYFENNMSTAAFTPQRLEFLKVLSSQIAISIENARLYYNFERFVPKQFLELLGKEDLSSVKLGDSIQKNITVLFTDIRGFTTLTEQQNVAYVFDLLNQYLSYVEPIITQHNGFIDKFIGDAIMALFPRNADDAVNAAIEIQDKLIHFNSQHNIALAGGIGISTGLCMLGTVGSSKRMDGTVISDTVNTASRIENLNKTYNTTLLISEQTRIKLQDAQKYSLRFIGKVKLRGKQSENLIWEVLDGLPEHLKEKRFATLSRYEQAVQYYNDGDYKEARTLLLDCHKEDPDDEVIELLLKSVEQNLGF